MKINCISTYENEQSENKNKKTIPFSIKKNKILMNKLSKRSTSFIHWKFQNNAEGY